MGSVTHYPGPWEVYYSDDGRVWVEETTTPERLIVCDIPGDMETIEGPQLANANLCAAAPDLLEALEEIAEMEAGRRATILARKALAKARGDQ